MILAILQARMSSTRLPSKVLMPILGVPMLGRQIERIQRAKKIDKLVVATSTDSSDDVIVELCKKTGIDFYRGSLNDVLDRYYQAAKQHSPDTVVRLTADCPLVDPAVIDELADFFLRGGYDYASNSIVPTYPDGMDAEIFKFSALTEAWRKADLKSQREHVTAYIYNQASGFRLGCMENDVDHSNLRWTVDEPLDYELVTRIYEALYPKNPEFAFHDILEFLDAHPKLKTLNTHFVRNEGYQKSLKEDALMTSNTAAPSGRYSKSEKLLEKAQKTIPLGTQTFSKSKTQYPFGVSPYFVKKAKGSRVWDVDGNEYVDFINSLNAITLGYNDPDVSTAVRAQLEDGVIFSLPCELEMQVAEKIVELVPCAEMVRFGKNGSDATAGAVRLARAFTKRDHVAACGYHGWQDWYIGSTARNLGVPQATRELTHLFQYNDLASLDAVFKKYPGQIATVIMEPMNSQFPKPNFLEEVKELAHKNGALLIFDETITGFRFANGGAQESLKVIPDLATFGKGMANGYPVSAIAGKAEIMRLMEEIFFSFTFGGEALSLAAALATLNKLQREPVVKTLYSQGEKVIEGVKKRIEKAGIEDILAISGNPTWSFLTFKDQPNYTQWQIKTLFLQEMFEKGILILSTHNMSYAHSDADIAKLLLAYDDVFARIKEVCKDSSLEKYLRCKPLEPLFKLR